MNNKFQYLLIVLVFGLGLTSTSLPTDNGLRALSSNAISAQSRQVRNNEVSIRAYLPVIINVFQNPTVYSQDRQGVITLYNEVYLGSEKPDIDWTGKHKTCNAGTTSDAFKEAVLTRINYFRTMAGVPTIVGFLEEYNQKAQEAALMMSVNDLVNHTPDPSWKCYTDAGYEAAQSSNLFLGYNGWDAIDGYMKEPGSGNYAVGHRRWVLYPQTQNMGTGDIPASGGHLPANALWVFDANVYNPRPYTRDEFVAWPPPGYVPYQIVYPRWSFSYGDADFSQASVSMIYEGKIIPVNVQEVVYGYGENTIVWQPETLFDRPPISDSVHAITITNVIIDGSPQSFVYDVIIIDPGSTVTANSENRFDPQLGPPPKFPSNLDFHTGE